MTDVEKNHIILIAHILKISDDSLRLISVLTIYRIFTVHFESNNFGTL